MKPYSRNGYCVKWYCLFSGATFITAKLMMSLTGKLKLRTEAIITCNLVSWTSNLTRQILVVPLVMWSARDVLCPALEVTAVDSGVRCSWWCPQDILKHITHCYLFLAGRRFESKILCQRIFRCKSVWRRNIGRPTKRWRDQIHFEHQGTGNTPNLSGTWWWWWWWSPYYTCVLTNLCSHDNMYVYLSLLFICT